MFKAAMVVLKLVVCGGSLFATYEVTWRVAYEHGATAGYAAGVSQDKLYQRGHAMAENWETYRIDHQIGYGGAR